MNYSGQNQINGHVSGSYVNLMFDWLEAVYPSLLNACPFQRPVPGELHRVSAMQWRAMLDWVFEQTNNPDMPLLLAASIKPSNTGLLGYVASSCSTLGEAFARLQRFENLIYAVNSLQSGYETGAVCLRWGVERGKPGHWVDSVAIAALVAFSRGLVSKPLNPLSIKFVNPPVRNAMAFEAFFQSPVLFGQAFTEVKLPVDCLAWPIKAPDPAMRAMLEQQADALLEQVRRIDEPVPGLNRAIQNAVTRGAPELSQVAFLLNMSERTLQRRLQAVGLSFRDCLTQVRMAMASSCLQSGELSLADIAQLLGYNDQSAFTHAFKRVTGQSPAAFRRRPGGGG